jgi:hypothetical protein
VRTNLGHVSACEVVWGKCLGMGCSDNREMHILPVGAFVEGELALVMDAIVS